MLQDIWFRNKGCHIHLSVDNFDGHKIVYKLTNNKIKFFKANHTSWIQPLNAGIIWTFKAYYHLAFYNCVVECYEASDEFIYKINQLEIMLLA